MSADNSNTEQASRMQNLILQGDSAITVLAGSDTALDGVAKDACDAGIVVVAFASGVTEPSAYRVDYDLDRYGKAELDNLARRVGNKDPILLEIRGQADDGFDKRLHEGALKAPKDHPTCGVRIVGSDGLSIDPFDSTAPAHRTLLGAGILIGENFARSGTLPPVCSLAALPLPVVEGSGAPLRAIAFVPRSA